MGFVKTLFTAILIGKGNFGSELQKYFEAFQSVEWIDVINSEREKDYAFYSETFKLLGIADFIVIACPDPFHIDWLIFLSQMEYEGHIFCEKSPVTNIDQLRILREIKNLNLYFNFPLNFTNFFMTNSRSNVNSKIELNWGHNLALKDKYIGSWRSKSELCEFGVATSLAIHFVNQALYLYGNPEDYSTEYCNLSQTGTSPDTFKIDMRFKDEVLIKIHCSYAVDEVMNITFEDGKVIDFLKIGKDFNRESSGQNNIKVNEYEISQEVDPFLYGNLKSVEHFLHVMCMKEKFAQDLGPIYRSLELLFI